MVNQSTEKKLTEIVQELRTSGCPIICMCAQANKRRRMELFKKM